MSQRAAASGAGAPGARARCTRIAASAIPVHLVLALTTELSPDEAYYLAAARLGARIPDHPPLTVAMLGASDRLTFLPVELRVRLWAIAASFATSLLVAELARRRGASVVGCAFATWVATWALLPMAGGFVTTPDTALLLCVAIALASEELAGPALALGVFAKVSALPVAALLASQQKTARAWTVLAVVAATALLLPELRFQLLHAFARDGGDAWSPLPAVGAVAALVSGQLALWSPAAFVMGIVALRRSPRRDQVLVAGMTALMIASAIVRAIPPEPNWWAPAALAVLPAMGLAVERVSSRARRWVLASVIAPTLIAVAHTAHPFLPLAAISDPTARLHGWRTGRTETEAAAMPGVGAYGAAAEACIYAASCDGMQKHFDKLARPPLPF